jgi:hypothetical protein
MVISNFCFPYVGFEVLTAVVMKSSVLWKVSRFHAGFFLVFFDHENGGDIFLWNVGWFSAGYTALIRNILWTSITYIYIVFAFTM